LSLLFCLLSVFEFQAGLPLEAVLARRAYESTVNYLLPTLEHDSTDARTMRILARIYDHWHKYDSSVIWWERSFRFEPIDSAVSGRWLALYRRDEKDAMRLPATKLLIRQEALPYLAESTQRSLTLAYDGLSLADSASGAQAAALLARLFPDSPRGYELVGTMFYDSLYPVWTDDTAKIPIIRRFLTRYPTSEWRQTFYMFMLSSYFGLKDSSGLRAAAAEMTQDDTLDPFRFRYAAALFNRLKLDPAQAAAYARSAIRLEPTAKKPANKPQEQWNLDYPPLYGLARVALAEALLVQGKLEDAIGWLRSARDGFVWDPQQEATPAALCCLEGEYWERASATDPDSFRRLMFHQTALGRFADALAAGDSRNQWSVRAESGLARVNQHTGWQMSSIRQAMFGYWGATFTDVTDSFGLADRKESRVAWGDCNNDGSDDLLLNGCVLFRNDAGRGFTNVTDSAGLKDVSGRGGLFADFNNDGWLDLYVSAGSGPDWLLKNDNGRFVNLSDRAGGPSDSFPTEGAGWADYDNDGWVDLYCANYENWEQHSYYPDKLYHNERGYLADVTKTAGIIPPYGIDLAGRGVNWGDYDDDGLQDCYVSNYRLCENFLWHNRGDGTFENVAAQEGVAGDEVAGWYGHTIGSTWGDYDNDGDLDLFTADLAHPRYIEFSNRSRLYENLGPKASPRFRDRRAELGIRYEETHSDPAWADVDNDGDLDLYITSIYEGRRSFLYENKLVLPPSLGSVIIRSPGEVPPLPSGAAEFREVTWLSGTRCYNGWGCAFSDFDNDGDVDLVVGSGSGLRLFRNDTENGNNWLKVKVVGTKANRAGIGCRVTVIERNKRRQMREVEGGKGTMSQNSLIQHFGLGKDARPVTVQVRFAPGRVTTLKNVKPDQLITVIEP